MQQHRAQIMSFFGSSTNLIDSPAMPRAYASPRAALVVCRHLMGQPHFLLISTRRDEHRLTLPGGKVDADESPIASAIRETIEEAGVLTHRHQPLGSYPHEKASGRVHHTVTYLAQYAGYRAGHERRTLHWLTVSEILDPSRAIRRPIREQIELAMDAMPAYTAAA